MALATSVQTRVNVFRFNTDDSVSWEPEPPRRSMPADLAVAPGQWLWCFQCERAFRAADVTDQHGEVSCAYDDCAALPADFWKWESYRLFAGPVVEPEVGRTYPLASAAA